MMLKVLFPHTIQKYINQDFHQNIYILGMTSVKKKRKIKFLYMHFHGFPAMVKTIKLN